jgi:site-specific recombinase XerD
MTHRSSIPSPDEAVTMYLDFIVHHRGLSVKTFRQRRTALRAFCSYLTHHHLTLDQIAVKDLDDFIKTVAHLFPSRAYLSAKTCALRGYFRYLFSEGILSRDLSHYVESPRIYSDATPPPHFTWSEVLRLCKSIKGDDSVALRDKLMMAILCAYGLRIGEIVSLTLMMLTGPISFCGCKIVKRTIPWCFRFYQLSNRHCRIIYREEDLSIHLSAR